MAIAAIGSQPCGMSYASLAVSGSNPAIWCTTSPLAVASIESCRLAAPTSYCALRFGALFFANASSATAITRTGAFFAQFALNSTSAPSDFSKFSASSFVATIYAHGCSLLLDGAHRAASNRLRSTSCGTCLSLNARGLQRFWINSCTGNSTGAGLLICVLQWQDRLRYFAACFTISRSIVTFTLDVSTSWSSQTTVPLTFLNSPRTVEIIMCFTANCAAVCAGSICHVVVAAVACSVIAAVKITALTNFLIAWPIVVLLFGLELRLKMLWTSR